MASKRKKNIVLLYESVTTWDSVFSFGPISSLSQREARRGEPKLLIFTIGIVLNGPQIKVDLGSVYLIIILLSVVEGLRIAEGWPSSSVSQPGVVLFLSEH